MKVLKRGRGDLLSVLLLVALSVLFAHLVAKAGVAGPRFQSPTSPISPISPLSPVESPPTVVATPTVGGATVTPTPFPLVAVRTRPNLLPWVIGILVIGVVFGFAIYLRGKR